ncbi:Alpha/Beta hydrolase protein [Gongronella butleri]|nr:Alpha/Beta hydrolase protein [Gongronella butleri]
MSTATTLLETDDGSVETRVSYRHTNAPVRAIIISHPYGPLGGNMQNNVVVALHKAFAQLGYVAVSFNFRGSGRSSGRTSYTGIAEQRNYQAVVDHVLKQYPNLSHLFLCGYSYGSMIASSVRVESVPTSHILISYPLSVRWALATTKNGYFKEKVAELLAGPERTLILHGTSDQFTGASAYDSWLASVGDNVDRRIVDGADHFWFDREPELVDLVVQFCESQAN